MASVPIHQHLVPRGEAASHIPTHQHLAPWGKADSRVTVLQRLDSRIPSFDATPQSCHCLFSPPDTDGWSEVLSCESHNGRGFGRYGAPRQTPPTPPLRRLPAELQLSVLLPPPSRLYATDDVPPLSWLPPPRSGLQAPPAQHRLVARLPGPLPTDIMALVVTSAPSTLVPTLLLVDPYRTAT